MIKFILFITLAVFSGCTVATQNHKILDIEEVKNAKNLTDLNSILPAKIDDDTILMSVVKKKRNNQEIIVYNYQLAKYEQGFIDLERIQMEMHISKCPDLLKSRDSSVKTFSYIDKNSVHLGEFNFSKYTCTAIYYVYKNDVDKFKKFLYSLSDVDFMNMGFKEFKFFKGNFNKVFGDRLLDTDLNVE
jgi:hypothetical protein